MSLPLHLPPRDLLPIQILSEQVPWFPAPPNTSIQPRQIPAQPGASSSLAPGRVRLPAAVVVRAHRRQQLQPRVLCFFPAGVRGRSLPCRGHLSSPFHLRRCASSPLLRAAPPLPWPRPPLHSSALAGPAPSSAAATSPPWRCCWACLPLAPADAMAASSAACLLLSCYPARSSLGLASPLHRFLTRS